MADITVETELAAEVEEVWEDICDIASHVEWMHDAEAIVFTSDQTQGLGTTFDCLTKVGPIRLTGVARGAWRELTGAEVASLGEVRARGA